MNSNAIEQQLIAEYELVQQALTRAELDQNIELYETLKNKAQILREQIDHLELEQQKFEDS
ncbi:hypothetical protein [Gayadomonas joobiniege]|uniref:hypothetical protein n=1 Tax=Gayadomonas joobiniege TaxID=1234606 RepID=UPI0003722B5C|nr:hypothetical protein [Gayadomonas joobiniege]